jgi:hypothetical protein
MRPSRFPAAGALLAWTLAAPGAAAADTCECAASFAHVTGYVERNYAGFPDKVTAATRAEYAAARDALGARAAAVPAGDDAACHALLVAYIDLFRDRHLSVSYRPAPPAGGAGAGAGGDAAPPGDDAIRARFADRPARAVTEEEARALLAQRQQVRSPIEGIWEMVGADYRLAVLPPAPAELPGGPPAPRRYEAVTLRADGAWWVPGQIKARLEETGPGRFAVEFFMRDHTPRGTTAELADGVLVVEGLSPWARVWPDDVAGYDPERSRADASRELAVRRLDEETLVVRLPDFNGRLAPRIDSLVQAHREELARTPHLILDVRGNGGGADISFHPFRPLFYTRPIITAGLSMLATAENIASFEALLAERGLPADLLGLLERYVQEARAHEGGWVPAPADTFRLAAALPAPRRVAILADRWCASSCEALLLAARQSDKVTIYGENTGGLTDYGNVMTVATPCPSLRLHVPTARSGRLPAEAYDLVGIPPDVRIPPSVLYPVEWVSGRMKDEAAATTSPRQQQARQGG